MGVCLQNTLEVIITKVFEELIKREMVNLVGVKKDGFCY